MAQTLDDHWYAKLGHEHIREILRNPKLEADLYPVGSWRDHPPTGLVVDLTKPQPQPAKSDDDDDEDEPSTATDVPEPAAGVAVALNEHDVNGALNKHNFPDALNAHRFTDALK